MPDIDDIGIEATAIVPAPAFTLTSPSPRIADSRAVEEQKDFESRAREDRLLLNNANRRQDMRLRLGVAVFIGLLSTSCIATVFRFIWLSASLNVPFYIADKVQIALIGSVAGQTVGLVYVVANYLFPKAKPTRPNVRQ